MPSFLRRRRCLTRYTLHALAHPTHSDRLPDVYLHLQGLQTKVSLYLIYRRMYRCSVHLFKSTNSAGLPSVYLI